MIFGASLPDCASARWKVTSRVILMKSMQLCRYGVTGFGLQLSFLTTMRKENLKPYAGRDFD